MLVNRQPFKVGVQRAVNAVVYTRLASGEIISELASDDVLVPPVYKGELVIDDNYVIVSLKDLRKKFFQQWMMAAMLVFAMWVGAILTLYKAMTMYLQNGSTWAIFLWPAVFIAGIILYTPQAVNPTVRDIAGHWINLRTGVSNLNGRSVLKNVVKE